MKRAVLLCLIVVVTFSTNSFAYGTFGEVNRYLKFSDIDINGNGNNLKVCGVLENITNNHVSVFTDILFKSRSELINSAKLHIKVQPNSSSEFCEYLKKSNYRDTEDALFLEWDVYMLSIDGKQELYKESLY